MSKGEKLYYSMPYWPVAWEVLSVAAKAQWEAAALRVASIGRFGGAK